MKLNNFFNIDENFANGKGPGKPGDSQRHGIPKKATMAELEKASHASGRKGQLARWQLNMRRGRKKANEDIDTNSFKDILKVFLPIAKKIIKLDKMPVIVLRKQISQDDQPTMGRFHNDSYMLELAVANRQPVDVLRTLAHELVHAKQNRDHVDIDPTTGSPEENEANVLAGIVMRHFNKLHPEYLKAEPISEGGNLSSHKDDNTPMPGWQGVPGQHQAQELDLNVHNRSYVVGVLTDLLEKINNLFAQQYKEPLWHKNSVEAQKFLSGSTAKFFDKKISDEEFLRVKPKVGDIDTQAPDKHAETIRQFLSGLIGKKVGDTKFIGFSPGNNQYTSMWEVTLSDLPVKLQIDFEYGEHDTETGLPTPWQDYSHSSSWEDLSAGIKGVFHKYIDRALPYAANVTTKYVARVLKKSTKISDEPVTDSDYSFAVSGQGGGGVSRKYVPYNDPNTGEPMEKNGIPVMQLLDPANRQYIKNLSQQFEIFFGQKPSKQDQQLKNSFIGTVQLATKYLDDEQRTELFRRFVSICFEPGSQMITKNDPVRDRDTKMAAIDYMVENLKLPNAQGLRKEAINTAMAYEQAFTNKKAAKAPVAESLVEADVKAQLRKGMPHLRDLKPADLLDLIDEIHDGNGNFKLQNIPLNVKVDGFGGRFGKNADGKPFMGTSRTEPRYEAGFVKYHQQKGTSDPEVLGRAQLFDKLFDEMMEAIKLVDGKLGPDFLIDKQVTCEVLFLPFATRTDSGRLKFVGIEYDDLPKGVELALVPFRVVEASTGEDIPNADKVIKALTGLGKAGRVMFIDNSLTQNEALDVTAIVPPLENIEQIKSLLASGKLAQKREAKELLAPVAIALEKAIIEDPNIVGKDMLGKDYEGIVLNTRLGPVKVTSKEQRDVIAAKNAAKQSARTERPRTDNKTAVVAVGSFVGHVGHEQLFDYTIKKAQAVGGDPYLFMGNAVGKDDPIPVQTKLETWHKLYPEYASNISAVTQQGGTLMQKIKHELINPLPGKPPRYDNIIIMVGEDQANMNIANALMKAVNKFQGYEHVKVALEATPRGTGMSFTKLRNILKDPKATPEQQYQVWSQGFDEKKLGKDWILHLMDVTRKGMGVATTHISPSGAKTNMSPKDDDYAINYGPKGLAKAQPEISEMRLFNALISAGKLDEAMLPTSAFTGTDKNKLGTAGQLRNQKRGARAGDLVGEAPIEMDPADPMDPMIHSYNKANPAKLKYRMMRAAGQLKDLAARAPTAGPAEWQTISAQFKELQMNIEQIEHALAELAKQRRKGGIKSRGIDPHIDEKWTQKYKSSINCSNPKGFSQKAHCAGRKKHNEGVAEARANTANARAGYSRRAAITAMSPEERAAYDKKRAEQQRKRDDARLERERQKNGVAEGYGRYYCSTDKKWKTRKGPKQTRSSESVENKCVPLGEGWESQISSLIKILENK